MANAKPIFCVTHPRACSTAFERVFMTRVDDLACVHEPFGDAFYYGPERLSSRYEHDEQARQGSGFAESTFKTIFERIGREGVQDKRIFIKDIIHYLLPPNGKPAQIAPSLLFPKRGIGTTNGDSRGPAKGPPFPYGTPSEPGNPTVVPSELLKQFHFTFLIRDPHCSIPSYFRCTIPPLDEVTGFYDFYPSEAGYDEVRRVFDFLVTSGLVGPRLAGKEGEQERRAFSNDSIPEICVVDADDLLDHPEDIVKQYCKSVGLDFHPSMLVWDSDEAHNRARAAFEKWKGFHDDAINSKDLKPRTHKAKKTEAEYDAEWKEKYGEKGARIIRETVDENMPTYLYLKQFAMKV